MLVLIGATTSFTIQRGESRTYRVQIVDDNAVPLNLLSPGTTKVLLDVSGGTLTVPYSILVTPDATRGTYGQGSFTIPSTFTALTAGTYTVRGRVDDGTGTSGQILSVVPVTAGGGYRARTTLALSDPTGGSGSALTPTMAAVAVSSGTLTAVGASYDGFVTAALSGGGGVGSSFTAIAAGPIATLSLVAGGSGFITAPTVTFTGSGGSGATATSALSANTIRRILITNGGSAYGAPPTLTVINVTGATATCTISGGVVVDIQVTNPGNGVVTGVPSVTFSGGAAAATVEMGPGSIRPSTVVVGVAGTGYTVAPTLVASVPNLVIGKPAAATVAVSAGGLTTVTVTDCGFGYTGGVTWTVVPDVTGGTGGTVTGGTPLTGFVSSLTLLNPGDGYPVNTPAVSATTVTVSGGSGAGAYATLTIAGYLRTITLANGGSLYTDAPTLTLAPAAGFGGSGAAALANLSTSIVSVASTAGSGYFGYPTVVNSVVTPTTLATFTVNVGRGVTQISNNILTLTVV